VRSAANFCPEIDRAVCRLRAFARPAPYTRDILLQLKIVDWLASRVDRAFDVA